MATTPIKAIERYKKYMSTHNTTECPYCHGHDCPECDAQTQNTTTKADWIRSEIEGLEEIRTAIKEKSGWTKNTSYHLEVQRRLRGNYLTENIKPEALSQITLEAEEVKIEEILRLFTSIITRYKEELKVLDQ